MEHMIGEEMHDANFGFSQPFYDASSYGSTFKIAYFNVDSILILSKVNSQRGISDSVYHFDLFSMH